MKAFFYIVAIVLFLTAGSSFAQNGKPVVIPTDSTTMTKNPAFTKDTGYNVINNDTVRIIPKHNPRTATLRSLIIPGWGQAYNREYWKIPIVYGALGTVAGIFIYNNTWYKRTKKAYELKLISDTITVGIDPRLQPLSAFALEDYRNQFRRDRDYSALWFVIMWGLNIVDATVFAHLKEFDVSEDLSLKINPVLRGKGNAGVSLVLGYKSPGKGRSYVLP